MNTEKEKTFTADQAAIVNEYKTLHGIRPEQISFEGNEITPIFDHEAISILSLKLTDIQDISPNRREFDETTMTVFASTTLPDGRTRGSMGSCEIGEVLGNGSKVENKATAEGVATSRAFRSGIRNVGIDLHRAHKRFVQTGQTATGHTSSDPRQPVYAEIHVLATELGYIVDGDKTEYRNFLAESYEGRTSAKDLNDMELHRLVVQFRSLARLQRNSGTKQAA